MRKLLILFLSINIFFCCSENNTCNEHPVVENSKLVISFERLENDFLSIKTREELKIFIQRHPSVAKYFLRRADYPNDSIMTQAIYQRLTNPYMDTLRQEVNKVFGDLSDIRQQFKQAFRFFQYYYPNFSPPKIKTIATGFDTDLYVSDSLIIIGLDFYLGKNAKFRPIHFPNYILKRYQKEYIVPSCILLYGISPRFNWSNLEDKTMLAEMIDYGKSFYFSKKMMPCTHDSLLIWYSGKELLDSKNNEDIIWAHFLDNELLYTSNKFAKQKYLRERPNTFDIGEKCPGRIGTWLGWQIVNQYMDRHPNTSLPELMKNNHSQEIFRKAKYRPKK